MIGIMKATSEAPQQRTPTHLEMPVKKFLACGEHSSDTSASIISLHRGEGATMQVAERILSHFKKMPQDSISMYTTSMYTTF